MRWHQQTAKVHGWLAPVPGRRGAWQLTDKARRALTPQKPKMVLVAYSTDLGVCLWGAAEDVFSKRGGHDDDCACAIPGRWSTLPYGNDRPKPAGVLGLRLGALGAGVRRQPLRGSKQGAHTDLLSRS